MNHFFKALVEEMEKTAALSPAQEAVQDRKDAAYREKLKAVVRKDPRFEIIGEEKPGTERKPDLFSKWFKKKAALADKTGDGSVLYGYAWRQPHHGKPANPSHLKKTAAEHWNRVYWADVDGRGNITRDYGDAVPRDHKPPAKKPGLFSKWFKKKAAMKRGFMHAKRHVIPRDPFKFVERKMRRKQRQYYA